MGVRCSCSLVLVLSLTLAIPSALGQAPNAYSDYFLQLPGPPVAQITAENRAAGNPLTPSAQMAHQKRLVAQQSILREQLDSLGIPVVYAYQRVLNGLQVHVSPTQQTLLSRLKGVIKQVRLIPIAPLLDESVPHLGLPMVLETLGLDGTGVDIGIVDSGIDYLHTAFGGPGTTEAYNSNETTTIDDLFNDLPMFPTEKVVGGIDLVGSEYDPSASTPPIPDPDPMPDTSLNDDEVEYNEHGTHVAAIAAGLPYEGGSPGIAPGARLWAVKVFASASTAMALAAVEWATDPNKDGDLSDALDVLNMSLGSGYSGDGGSNNALYSEAIGNFVATGGVVVGAAGNAGNRPFATSSPSCLPQVISVANSFGPGEFGTFVRVDNPIDGDEYGHYYNAREGKGSLVPSLEESGDIVGELFDAGDGCEPDDYDDAAAGKVALIVRGECLFVTKFQYAEIAGALAVVVYQHNDKKATPMDGEPKVGIPGVMITKAHGQLLLEELAAGSPVQVTVSSKLPWYSRIDAMHNSSSRGPAYPFHDTEGDRVVAKPDLTAPGANIHAAKAGAGNEITSKTGTSMAAPHVAGVVALVRQAHPDWTPRDIKALLMNTAYHDIYQGENKDYGGNGDLAPYSLGGAGRVAPLAALSTDVIAYSDPEVTMSLGLMVLTEPTSEARTITVENKGDSAVTYTVQSEVRTNSVDEDWVQIELSTSEITVEAKDTASFQTTFVIDPSLGPEWKVTSLGTTNGYSRSGNYLRTDEFDGAIVLTPVVSDGQTPPTSLRVPFYLLFRKPSRIDVSNTCLGPPPQAALVSNHGPGKGKMELFTLIDRDPNEEGVDIADIRAIGLRTGMYGKTDSIAVAIHTDDYRMHTNRVRFFLFIDTNEDGIADYVVMSVDDAFTYGGSMTGRMKSLVLSTTDANNDGQFDLQTFMGSFDVVAKHPLISDVLTSNVVLTMPIEGLGLSDTNTDFRFWVASFDLTSDGVTASISADVLPDDVKSNHLLYSQSFYSVDLQCLEWTFDSAVVTVEDEATIPILLPPSCSPLGLNNPLQPPGILALTNGAPGPDEAVIIDGEALSPTVKCVAEHTLSVDSPGCVANLNPDIAVAPTHCSELLSTQTSAGETLPIGTRDVVVAISDPWANTHLCTVRVTVVDDTPPVVDCPTTLAEQITLPSIQFTPTATDPCVDSTTVHDLRCVAEDGATLPCALQLDGDTVRLDRVDTAIAAIEWRMVATDTSNNTTERVCTVPIAHLPPLPVQASKPSGGCRTQPRSHNHVPMDLVMVLCALGWIVRSRRPTPG